MSQGIFLHVDGKVVRPQSKKQIKETSLDKVALEATSAFGNEYSGQVSNAPDGTYNFVGPDPYNNRKFYGIITVKNGTVKIK